MRNERRFRIAHGSHENRQKVSKKVLERIVVTKPNVYGRAHAPNEPMTANKSGSRFSGRIIYALRLRATMTRNKTSRRIKNPPATHHTNPLAL